MHHSKTKQSFLTAFATLILSLQLIQAIDIVEPNKLPSQSLTSQITINVLDTMLLSEHVQAIDCHNSILDIIDQAHFFHQNRTLSSSIQTSGQLETALNFTALLSDSATRMVRYCPVAIEGELNAYARHFQTFQNTSIGQISEGLMFGLLVHSLAMRKTILAIQILDERGEIAQIVKELVIIGKQIVLFENIYANGADLSPTRAFADQDIEDAQVPDFDFLKPPGAAESALAGQTSLNNRDIHYNSKPYKAYLASFYRFADFFNVQSLTYNCADKVSLIEQSSIDLAEIESWGNVTAISHHFANILEQSHPFFWSCAYSLQTELALASTYIEFSNPVKTVETLQSWFVQDQRVFANLLEVYTLLSGDSSWVQQQTQAPQLPDIIDQIKVQETSSSKDAVDYNQVGFYIGDSLARLVLQLGDD